MNTPKKALLSVICATLGFLSPSLASAQNENEPIPATASVHSDTLEKARQSGAIAVGYRNANVPFSYQDSSHQPTGYTKELCDQIVDAIKLEYGMPHLKIVYRLVTAQERIPMLQNGTIDMECSSSSITPERQNQVDFSIAYYLFNIRLLTRKAYHIQNLSDLANKTIVFTTGTTTEEMIREKLDVERNHIMILRGKSHAESFMMVRTGRAAAYLVGDVLLAGLITSARDPNAYEIVGPSLSTGRYAIMVRKGDTRLKAAVNRALTDIIVSGKIKEMYDRWFTQPIPPYGANMNMPMSEELAQFFARQTRAAVSQKTETNNP
ncbi:MAG: amino acid ABC transporter substrate-binding protein [Azoarcus sp.]|nr:amino acid ABC transporter substrate-binding protein [Azoarcus sp.]